MECKNRHNAALKNALRVVIHQRQHAPPQYIHNLEPTHEEEREVLHDILISSNEPWRDDVLRAVDLVYGMEVAQKAPTEHSDLPCLLGTGNTTVSVWKGDITDLRIDAIVNTANDSGLGCFQPNHKCIDNVIHSQAGPRLRMECSRLMAERGSSLAVGTEPIITDAYFLPSNKVIHVTGPHVTDGNVTDGHKMQLQRTYVNVLEAAARQHIRSVAFCGISTGLFGFPKAQAAAIATRTVVGWLKQNPNVFDAIVFDTFSDSEEVTYKRLLCTMGSGCPDASVSSSECQQAMNLRCMQIATAKKWIDDADSVLICAGAGMSAYDGYNVYVNKDDFGRHYPWMLKYGYKTCYETMGLLGDPQVPLSVKWAQFATHMDNMRWKFPPNKGYEHLRQMVGDKDYFVLTSNVEAMFERSGFDKERIYTPQGEWTYYQCVNKCREDSVFESRPMLDKLLPQINNGDMPNKAIPSCPRCKGPVFPNVRGGSFFSHSRYDEQNLKIRRWMRSQIDQGKKVVAIEVGAGFNTPMVTRMPTESFITEAGGTLIRINPTDVEIPRNTKAVGIAEGWEVLADIAAASGNDHYEEVAPGQEDIVLGDLSRVIQYFGHFEWDTFLQNLR